MGIVTAAAIAGGAAIAGSAIGAISAGSREKRARNEKNRLQGQLESLENSRQEIINPFEAIFDISNMITDTSDVLSNTYANLGVATQAAEFQAEEADIALANTLDTLRATGSSAGGATALAQAALQSKRGVSSSIEQQEATNMKLRAQGEQSLQQARFGEAQRVQGGLVGEARRLQQADVSGREFTWGQRERREGEKLNRLQAQITGQQQAEIQAGADKTGAIMAGVTAVGNIGSSVIGAGGGGGKPKSGGMDVKSSDRRLKKNIKLIGLSPRGFKIYQFEYKDSSYGDKTYQGVMSDEIPSTAVVKQNSGYDSVDYSKIDVDFKTIII